MLLELMSNGTLAELPPEQTKIPENLCVPEETSIMLLLPHNKYLLGTVQGRWIYSSSDGRKPRNVFLYDGEGLSLMNEDGTPPTIISPVTVKALQKELLQLTDPPGRHASTVLMLHTLINFQCDNFLDEKIFMDFAEKDLTLLKAYWALRFGLARDENEIVARLKAWLKAGPENFDVQKQPKNIMRIWFTIQDLPAEEVICELEELSFSRLEILHLSSQKISPVVLYNPVSGWLVLGKFGREKSMIFIEWAFFSHELWHELRENKQMTVHDIILAAWAEHETRQAMKERAKYKGAETL